MLRILKYAFIVSLVCAFVFRVRNLTSTRVILVVYVFSATEARASDNLRFFVNVAVMNDRICQFIIVVQGVADVVAHLPLLPSHATYLHHANHCYDWGTYGWVLQSATIAVKYYRYFIFLNSSVRGPFLPVYAHNVVHWTAPFLQRLVGGVKLVGPTISCEGTPFAGNVSANWRTNPHVQSYAFATDQLGLDILLSDPGVFACHDDRWDAIYYSELGASAAILRAGFNIDCFMLRYQKVNWQNVYNCNHGRNPLGTSANGGITLDPLEVTFVKFKAGDEVQTNPASQYTKWMLRDFYDGV